MADGEEESRSRSRDRSDELPDGSSTELPGEQCDDDHDHGDHHRREHPQAPWCLAEHCLAQPADHRRDRPLIVVRNCGVSCGGPEVQLVAVVAVGIREGDLDDELGNSDRKNPTPSDRATNHA
jgi:hypothetical protein